MFRVEQADDHDRLAIPTARAVRVELVHSNREWLGWHQADGRQGDGLALEYAF